MRGLYIKTVLVYIIKRMSIYTIAFSLFTL